MMDFPIAKIPCREFSNKLTQIPDAPGALYMRGSAIPDNMKCLTVVGSRNYSDYGKRVVEYLISGLRSYPIAIITGLALGIDSLAHRSALDAGLYTLAVPGSGIDDSVIYPRSNRGLAMNILESGGGLMSEFEPTFSATQWSFPKRNRIMVGLADAVLLIEASERSGTLITARLTAEYNRDLLAVPGNIFSDNSRGVHQFLKLGATPVTTPEDIIDALHLTRDEKEITHANPITFDSDERIILDILSEPRDHDTIIRSTSLPQDKTLVLLMQMELDGKIKEQNGIFYKI